VLFIAEPQIMLHRSISTPGTTRCSRKCRARLKALRSGQKPDFFMRTTKAFGGITQEFGTEASEFTSKTGEELSGKMTEKANQATDKVTNAVKKAA